MPFHIEPAADGFWINPVGYPVGSVIHYRYHVLGAPQQSTALVETGGRQFIYTGGTPTDIMVTQITPPSGIPDQDTSWQWTQPTGGTTPTAQYPTARPVPPEDTSVSGGDFGGGEEPSQPSPAEEAPSEPVGGYPSAY